jgi:hypothetical protein
MSDPLDLSILTDDQLVGLARLIAAEAGRRKYDLQVAMKSAVLEESEAMRIAALSNDAELAAIRDAQRKRIEEEARAAARAANPPPPPPLNPQERLWAKKKRDARMIDETLGSGWTLTVWQNKEKTERRVYFDGPGLRTNRYGGKEGPHAIYYHTGNSKNAPGKLTTSQIDSKIKPVLLTIARHTAKNWSSVTVVCDEAKSAEVPELPFPEEYLKMRQSA